MNNWNIEFKKTASDLTKFEEKVLVEVQKELVDNSAANDDIDTTPIWYFALIRILDQFYDPYDDVEQLIGFDAKTCRVFASTLAKAYAVRARDAQMKSMEEWEEAIRQLDEYESQG